MAEKQLDKPGKPDGFGNDSGKKIGPNKGSPLTKESESRKFSGDYTKFTSDENSAVTQSPKKGQE